MKNDVIHNLTMSVETLGVYISCFSDFWHYCPYILLFTRHGDGYIFSEYSIVVDHFCSIAQSLTERRQRLRILVLYVRVTTLILFSLTIHI